MTSKQKNDCVKQLMKRFMEQKIFEQKLQKIKFNYAENGKCQAELKVEEEHTNMHGTLHCGFSATLVDSISTFALMTRGKKVPGVSVDMHIKYLKTGNIGDEIIIDAETIRAGRTLAFLDITIKNKITGEILIIGRHTKYIG